MAPSHRCRCRFAERELRPRNKTTNYRQISLVGGYVVNEWVDELVDGCVIQINDRDRILGGGGGGFSLRDICGI